MRAATAATAALAEPSGPRTAATAAPPPPRGTAVPADAAEAQLFVSVPEVCLTLRFVPHLTPHAAQEEQGLAKVQVHRVHALLSRRHGFSIRLGLGLGFRVRVRVRVRAMARARARVRANPNPNPNQPTALPRAARGRPYRSGAPSRLPVPSLDVSHPGAAAVALQQPAAAAAAAAFRRDGGACTPQPRGGDGAAHYQGGRGVVRAGRHRAALSRRRAAPGRDRGELAAGCCWLGLGLGLG